MFGQFDGDMFLFFNSWEFNSNRNPVHLQGIYMHMLLLDCNHFLSY